MKTNSHLPELVTDVSTSARRGPRRPAALAAAGFLALASAAVAQNQTINGNLTVNGWIGSTGSIDSDANVFTFGTQSGGIGAGLYYFDDAMPGGTNDTLKFTLNRISASWLWQNGTSTQVPAMRLDSGHQLILYQSDGTTAGVTLLPASTALKLGSTATLTGNGSGVLTTSGALSVGGALTATGTFTAPNAAFASGINGTPIGNTTPGTGTFSSLTVNGQITARTGSIAAIFGADEAATTLTNATSKTMRFGMPHYTNAEEPVGLIVGFSQSTGNALSIGGGTALFNAATNIDFFTAANGTTAIGTRRGGFTAAGAFDLTGGLTADIQRGTLVTGWSQAPYVFSSTFTGNADGGTVTPSFRLNQSAAGANNIPQLQGFLNYVDNNTTATVGTHIGAMTFTRVTWTGATTNMSGYIAYAEFSATGSGNVTGNYTGFRANSPSYTGTGRITGSVTGFWASNLGNASSSTVTGFDVSDQTKGSGNAYAFRGQMALAAGKYNLYMDGTAQNHLAGATSFGSTIKQTAAPTYAAGVSTTNSFVTSGPSAAGGTSDLYGYQFMSRVSGANPTLANRGVLIDVSNSSSATISYATGLYGRVLIEGAGSITTGAGVRSLAATTGAGTFTGSFSHYIAQAGSFSAGGEITGAIFGLQIENIGRSLASSVTGVSVPDLTKGSGNVYAYRGQVANAAGKYNLYMDGTAANHLAGQTSITNTTESTSSATGALTVIGGVGIGGNLRIGGTLNSTGTLTAPSASFASGLNGTPIGATTPGTGAFTTLSTTSAIAAAGSITSGGNFVSTSVDPYFRASVDNKHIVLSGGSGWATTGAVMVLRGATDTSNAHGLEMYTGSAERLRITLGGNIGIGTTTPAQKLDVEGSIRAGGRTRIEMDRTLGGAQGDTVAIGSFSSDGIGKNIRIYLKGHNAGVIDVQTYEINEIAYLGATTNWLEVPLNQNSVSYGGAPAYALDVFRPNINSLGDSLYLRIRVKRPVGSGNVQLVADFDDDSTFTPSTTAGSVSTVFNASSSPAGGAVDGYYGAAEWMFPVSNGTGWGNANGQGLYVRNTGNVGIGTINPTHKLSVNGTIRAKEIIVDTGWADYVFDESYRLAPLSEVEAHIKSEKHLPGVPSAAEVAEHGVSMGQMQSTLLAKVEELTLHLIAQEKAMATQQAEITALRREVVTLKAGNSP